MPTTNLNTINLISTKTGLSPQLELIDASLRRTSTIALALFVVAGVLVGALYLYFAGERTSQEALRTQLRSQISAAKNNEGLLVSIKDRTRIVERAMASQRPWAKTLDLVGSVAVPPALSRVSVDEQNTIGVTIQANSVDELLTPVNTFISYAKEAKIRNPRLVSVQFNKDGSVTMALSFIMAF